MAQTPTAPADTISQPKVKKKDTLSHQLCLGIDLFHPVINHFLTGRSAWEFQADYYLRNEFYGAMEMGWGGSKVSYTDLRYTTTNNFLRLGFNKTILTRESANDWDMMMFGLRVGAGRISRSAATFMVADSIWGNTHDSTLSTRPPFMAIWAELTLGTRVEITHRFYAGWNIRGKFMMNGRSFKDLSPLYIAGYGKGDKNSSFDFNVYLSYALRWPRKKW